MLLKTSRFALVSIAISIGASAAPAARADDSLGRALREAARAGSVRDVEALLARNAPLEDRSFTGRTALMEAALYGHAKVVRLLLAKGANFDATDDRDQTALHGAAWNCSHRSAEALIRRGANPNRRNSMGTTALMNAAEQGCLMTVQVLLSAREIDVNAVDDHGHNALYYADENAAVGTDAYLISRLLRGAGARELDDRPDISVARPPKQVP